MLHSTAILRTKPRQNIPSNFKNNKQKQEKNAIKHLNPTQNLVIKQNLTYKMRNVCGSKNKSQNVAHYNTHNNFRHQKPVSPKTWKRKDHLLRVLCTVRRRRCNHNPECPQSVYVHCTSHCRTVCDRTKDGEKNKFRKTRVYPFRCKKTGQVALFKPEHRSCRLHRRTRSPKPIRHLKGRRRRRRNTDCQTCRKTCMRLFLQCLLFSSYSNSLRRVI